MQLDNPTMVEMKDVPWKAIAAILDFGDTAATPIINYIDQKFRRDGKIICRAYWSFP